MLYNIIVVSIVILIMCSCNDSSSKKETDNTSNLPEKTSPPKTFEEHYFNFENTSLTKGFSDTVYALFSNDTNKDCFTLNIPSGNINETSAVLHITTQKGDIIYEHVFKSRELVNGYDLYKIKSDTEMEAYIINKAKLILSEGLLFPAQMDKEAYLNTAKEEDFEDYELFLQIKEKNGVLFHYCLQEESHYFLGFSKKSNKTVTIINCC